tara:strand:+ start:217 stop:570 length:354 start_codon:yes stop_codon:yes gene_type:complete
MSMDMTPRSVSFTIKVGSTTTLELTIKNADGTARDLTNSTTFYSGKWKVWQPDGTLLVDKSIVYGTRSSGIVTVTFGHEEITAAKAGIWAGEVELRNTSDVISEQTQTFNFTIEESY